MLSTCGNLWMWWIMHYFVCKSNMLVIFYCIFVLKKSILWLEGFITVYLSFSRIGGLDVLTYLVDLMCV